MKESYIRFRCSDEQKAIIEANATAAGQTVTEYLIKAGTEKKADIKIRSCKVKDGDAIIINGKFYKITGCTMDVIGNNFLKLEYNEPYVKDHYTGAHDEQILSFEDIEKATGTIINYIR